MFLVIGVHAVGSVEQYAAAGWQETIVNILGSLNDLGVPLFFALSGLFVLEKDISDIMGFYKERLIRIGIPYLIYSLIYVCYFTGYEEGNIALIPLDYVKDILTAGVHPTHWFVYSILGLYFAAPFLSRMVHDLSDNELMILTGGSIIVIILCRVFGFFSLGFGLDNVVFNTGNLFMFIAGYSVHRLAGNFDVIRKYHYVLSFLSVVIYIISGEMIFGQAAILLALAEGEEDTSTPDTVIDTAVRDMARYSYSVYLIHAAVISLILKINGGWDSYFILKCFLLYPAVFLISYVIVRILDGLVTDRIIRKIRDH